MKQAQIEVTLVDSMGGDLGVVNAARVSFDKNVSELGGQDAKLIQYLAAHNHWSPFGHAQVQVRCKAPLFVARQLGKHQVGLVWNEVSRRYVDSCPEFWIPEVVHQRPDKSLKQGCGAVHIDTSEIVWDLREVTRDAYDNYTGLLEAGVAPEEARIVLPQNTMTEWIWTGSVAAFARIIKLREDGHTQKSGTQEFAHKLRSAVYDTAPLSFTALLGE